MRQVGDDPHLSTLLENPLLDVPMSHRGLTIVPLLGTSLSGPSWRLLHEALAVGSFRVGEVTATGRVPSLLAVNTGTAPVLLLDGEELVGARQNRILNTSVLVGAGQCVTIPVSCVEHGRWTYQTRHFASSGWSLYASVRRRKAIQVGQSLARGGTHIADQCDIWTQLTAKSEEFGVTGRTGAMRDVFDHRALDLDGFRRALPARPRQVGALIYGGRAWRGLELLDSSRLFALAWPRLLVGYAMDALLMVPNGLPRARPITPLTAVLKARATTYPSPGLGADVRFQGHGIIGATLVADDRVAHLMAFPA